MSVIVGKELKDWCDSLNVASLNDFEITVANIITGYHLPASSNHQTYEYTYPSVLYPDVSVYAFSNRELERNIKSGYYKRILSTQFPDKTGQSSQFVKDPYVLEFMGIKDNDKIVERNVENAIISHLQKFLLEMGKGFCFVDRQMHICTETADFYIDLVFYNYILKCFVLINRSHVLWHLLIA